MMQIDLKSITFSIIFAIFLVLASLEPASAAEMITVNHANISFGTWILVGLGLAIFGFRFREK